jgi:alanine racemase
MDKWIEIDLSIIRNNIRSIKKSLKPGVKFIAVVKADAYGHGAEKISKIAIQEGVDFLGVLTVEEAVRLRKFTIKKPIVLLAPALPENAGIVLKHSLIPTVDSIEFLKVLNKIARRGWGDKHSYPVYVDVDLGLRRWGVLPENLTNFLKKMSELKNIKLKALSTHIAYVPGKNMVEAEEKLSFFEKLAGIAKQFYPGAMAHAANSSVLVDFPHRQIDMVRIGNLIYGIYPSKIYMQKTKGPPIKGIKRPWKFYAKIISIKNVAKGESIGYANEYVACRKMKIASIPVGYSDGLTMEPTEKFIKLSTGYNYWGMIGNRKAPFVGKSGIAHTLLDVTGVPKVKTGMTVLLPIRRTAANAKIPRIYKF